MTVFKFFLLSFLLVNALCILKKKKEKGQIKAKEGVDLEQYTDQVYYSIYYYKQAQQGITMYWSYALSYIAQREVEQIIQHNDFGTHTRFPDWVSLAPNDYFTEITLNIQLQYLPEANEFAEAVLQKILEEQPFYLAHEEDYIGIYMEEWPSNPNQFTLVIQLLKKPEYYTSCKDQLFYNEYSDFLTIKSNGELYDVYCDVETDNGGWTLISEMYEGRYYEGTVQINDLGLDYKELLWVATTGYYMDLNSQWSHDWDFSGWNLEINMLKFDGVWYLSEQTPDHSTVPQGAIRGSGFDSIKDQVAYFDKDNDIEMLQEASECNIRAIQVDGYCASKFIFKNVPGRIEAVSDVESISQVDNSDNFYQLNFQVYVR